MELVNKMELLKQLADKLNNSQWYSETEEGFEAAMSMLENTPTVEAISKDQYEAHLKADMVAMLEELQLEIEEIVKEEELIDKKWANGLHYSEKIIQQKINVLKEKENEQ